MVVAAATADAASARTGPVSHVKPAGPAQFFCPARHPIHNKGAGSKLVQSKQVASAPSHSPHQRDGM